MRCVICGAEVSIAVLFVNTYICENCHLRLNPPNLVLIQYWNTDALHEINSKKYIPHNINLLQSFCKFRIYERTTFLNSKVSPIVKEKLLLKYTGKCKCSLLDSLNSLCWPINMQKCEFYNSPACTLK